MGKKKSRNAEHYLFDIRESEGLTQEEFGSELGIERTLYGKIERDQVKPPYPVLEKILESGKNVDLALLGTTCYGEEKFEMSILHECMNQCEEANRRNLYYVILTSFFSVWKPDRDNHDDMCLLRELQAIIALIMDSADMNTRLAYLRETCHLKKVDLESILGITFQKRKNLENGEKMDGDLLIRLYKEGLCFPSFFFGDYICLDKIDYLLKKDKMVAVKFYQGLLNNQWITSSEVKTQIEKYVNTTNE